MIQKMAEKRKISLLDFALSAKHVRQDPVIQKIANQYINEMWQEIQDGKYPSSYQLEVYKKGGYISEQEFLSLSKEIEERDEEYRKQRCASGKDFRACRIALR